MDNILQAIETAYSEGRIPSIDEVGGLDGLMTQSAELAYSPYYYYILEIVLTASLSSDVITKQAIANLFNVGFEKNDNEIFVRDATLLLCEHSGKLADCFDPLLNLATNKNKKPFNRKYYLLGAFDISLADSIKRFKLYAFLLQVEPTDDLGYLEAVAKIIGINYCLFNQEELFQKLGEFCDNNVGGNDALFEMGMANVHKASNSSNRQEVIDFFQRSLYYFKSSKLELRPDAEAYAGIISILIEIAQNKNPTVIQKYCQNAISAIQAYVAWNNYDDRISWIGMRHTEYFNWIELATKISYFIEHQNKPAWYRPEIIIKDYLLVIYSCNRTILQKNENGGLELLLQPTINEDLAENETKIFLLDQWIEENKLEESVPIARKIRQEIENYKILRLPGKVSGTTNDLINQVVPSYNSLPNKYKTPFENFMHEFRQRQTTGVSRILKAVFNEICIDLSSINSYNDEVIRQSFQIILYNSLKFLELRMDNTVKNHPVSSYLFKGNGDPLEGDLQEDYFNFMFSALADTTATTEKSDISSGRVDVYFDFFDHHFVTEVKREKTDCSFEGLKKKYISQASEYQNTSAKMGILLVLDLTEKSEGIGSLEGNVKLEMIRKRDDLYNRAVVIIRVPGNRLRPSQL